MHLYILIVIVKLRFCIKFKFYLRDFFLRIFNFVYTFKPLISPLTDEAVQKNYLFSNFIKIFSFSVIWY